MASLREVVRFEYVGACRYTGYEAKSIKLHLDCGHDQGHRKASAGVPKRARCRDCDRGVAPIVTAPKREIAVIVCASKFRRGFEEDLYRAGVANPRDRRIIWIHDGEGSYRLQGLDQFVYYWDSYDRESHVIDALIRSRRHTLHAESISQLVENWRKPGEDFA